MEAKLDSSIKASLFGSTSRASSFEFNIFIVTFYNNLPCWITKLKYLEVSLFKKLKYTETIVETPLQTLCYSILTVPPGAQDGLMKYLKSALQSL